jgi:hypothetical protein
MARRNCRHLRTKCSREYVDLREMPLGIRERHIHNERVLFG